LRWCKSLTSGQENVSSNPTEPTAAFEIQQVLAKYCHVADDGDWSKFSEVFTTDATFDGHDIGMGIHEGLERIQDCFSNWTAPIMHMSTDFVITESLSDTVLMVNSKWLVMVTSSKFVCGEYFDRFVQTSDGWRIEERIATVQRRRKA
jgi:hypothetical protein